MAAKQLTEVEAFDATREAYKKLEPLDEGQRERALRWLIDALEVDVATAGRSAGRVGETPGGESTAVDVGDPKTFLASKQPKNNAQVLAVLGYILAKSGTPAYKAPDLEAMNTKAAGHRIANINRDLDNATRQSGYFTTASGGNKQLTAFGERVVEALPDQAAVKEVAKSARRPRRRTGKKSAKARGKKPTKK